MVKAAWVFLMEVLLEQAQRWLIYKGQGTIGWGVGLRSLVCQDIQYLTHTLKTKNDTHMKSMTHWWQSATLNSEVRSQQKPNPITSHWKRQLLTTLVDGHWILPEQQQQHYQHNANTTIDTSCACYVIVVGWGFFLLWSSLLLSLLLTMSYKWTRPCNIDAHGS